MNKAKKLNKYKQVLPLPILADGGLAMQPIKADISRSYMPIGTSTMQSIPNNFNSEIGRGNNYGLINTAIGAASGAASAYGNTGTAGGAVAGLVDSAIKSIPVAGQIISAVDMVADPIASAFGNAGQTNEYNQAAERLINPLNSLVSGISNLVDGKSKEGWNDLVGVVLPGYAGYNDAKWERERRAEIEKQQRIADAPKIKQREINAGYGGRYFDQNNLMQAEYGSGLPYYDNINMEKGGYVGYGFEGQGMADYAEGGQLPQITEYNVGGQHSENMNGGIPVDSQGNPAYVSGGKPVASTEEGEVSWFNPKTKTAFIFSNKIFIE